MTDFQHSPQWALLSRIVTQGKACRYCGTRHDLVAHHRVPRRSGGPNSLCNLEPVCRRCHPWVEAKARADAKDRRRTILSAVRRRRRAV